MQETDNDEVDYRELEIYAVMKERQVDSLSRQVKFLSIALVVVSIAWFILLCVELYITKCGADVMITPTLKIFNQIPVESFV